MFVSLAERKGNGCQSNNKETITLREALLQFTMTCSAAGIDIQSTLTCKVGMVSWLVQADFHLFVCNVTLFKANTSLGGQLELVARVSALERVHCSLYTVHWKRRQTEIN